MRRWIRGLAAAVITILIAWGAVSRGETAKSAGVKGSYLVILQAGKESHEGMARAVHALLYARELHEHGHRVVLLFDGAGTEWADEWTDPESTNKLTPMYRELHELGITEIICDFCAGAFDVKERLSGRNITLTGEFNGHPSIAKWADRGYSIIVL
jgi:hypothetical protein